LIVDWIKGMSDAAIVLFLMVMGNMKIIYQNRCGDASKKCTEKKKC